mgnify:CR=1 FL=1
MMKKFLATLLSLAMALSSATGILPYNMRVRLPFPFIIPEKGGGV